MMKVLPTILVWVGLLVLLVCEFVAARVPELRGIVPAIGIGMALLVAFSFMQLGSSRGLTPIFAVAGVFWLCIMLGLGSLDVFTRHDIPIPQQTYDPAP